MNLFCPACEAAYAGTNICPKCGSRLITPAEAFTLPTDLPPSPPPLIRPSAVARVVVGTVAGLGIYFAGRDCVSAVAVPSEESVSAWWAGPAGAVAGYVLRSLCAAVGGLFAGAGRTHGAITGLAAGLILGGLFLATDAQPGQLFNPRSLGTFAVVTLLAAATGLIGGRVWPPAAQPPRGMVGNSKSSSLGQIIGESKEIDGGESRPTRWFRILAGTVIAVIGVLYADAMRNLLRTYFPGMGNISNPGAAALIDLELAGIFVIFGGLLCGAGTGSGFRHGLITGVLTGGAVSYLGPRQNSETTQLLTLLLEMLDVYPDLGSVPAIGTIAGVTVAACVFAGWLGGQLLPPLAPPGMRSRVAS